MWVDCFLRETKILFLRDPRRAMFLFGASLAYLILFGVLYGPAQVRGIPLGVLDQDQSALSRSLTRAFGDSERFALCHQVGTEEEAERLLRERRVQAVLVIPPRFARNVKAGLSSPVMWIGDGSNIAAAGAGGMEAQEILEVLGADLGADQGAWGGIPRDKARGWSHPVELRLRLRGNPTLSYLEYFVIGLAMAAFQEGILLSVGAAFLGTGRRSGRGAEPVGVCFAVKLLLYGVCSLGAFALALFAGNRFFPIPFWGSWGAVGALGAFFSFGVALFAAAVACRMVSEVNYTRFALVYTVPAFILSGAIWPREAMGTVSRGLSFLFPLTWMVDPLRRLLLWGSDPGLARHLLILGGIGFLSLGTLFLPGGALAGGLPGERPGGRAPLGVGKEGKTC
ncbi:ABC transporter permease [Aminomonas paucivorans]|uniref:ABC transporter permease n=1 Tax=Aminomonas paucivorans TaxID=81412 RepID=UPI003323142F